MDKIGKLSSVVKKFNNDNEKNKKLYNKNKKLIDDLANTGNLLRMVFFLDCSDDKVYDFIDIFYDNASADIFIKNIIHPNNSGDNLLQFAYKYFPLDFFEKIYNKTIVKKLDDGDNHDWFYKLITNKNHDHEDFLDIFIKEYKNASELAQNSRYNMFLKMMRSICTNCFGYVIDNYDRILSIDLERGIDKDIIDTVSGYSLKPFCDVLTDDIEYNKKIFEKIFNNFDYYYPNENLLFKPALFCNTKAIEKLLQIGLDPNKSDALYECNSYINCVIQYNQLDVDSVKALIKTGLKYGADINARPSYLRCYMETSFDDDCITDLYRFLIENGFDTYYSDIDEQFIVQELQHSDSIDDFLRLYKINFIVDGLKNKLGNKNINLENDFKEKFKQIFNDFDNIKNRIQVFYGIENNKNFILRLSDIIIEQRLNSVNIIDNNVTLEEVFEALKIFILKNNDINFNYIDRCKEKVKELK